MEKRLGQVARFGLFLLALTVLALLPPLQARSAPYAAMVMDARTGEVLHSRNADTRLHPASLTKRPPLLCQQCHSASGHPGVGYSSDDLDAGSSNARYLMARGCQNCHTQVHGSNHPSGSSQIR